MTYAVGVDLGGTKTAVALVSSEGGIGEIITAPTPSAQGPAAVLDHVAALVSRVWNDEAVGLGVGAAGVVDSTRGTIISATETFTSWVGTNLVTGLRSRLDLAETIPIEVRNDVAAHALGEHWVGAARDFDSMLMVAVGTGVGGGVVLGGHLHTGARHVAGEIGHLPVPGAEALRCACGRFGHLEAIAAGPAIERRYAQLSGQAATGREIMELAEASETTALRVVQDSAIAIGKAICGVVSVLDPGCVVIGGGVAQAGGVWWGPLLETCRGDLIDAQTRIDILPAQLGTSAALFGAARTVFNA